MTIDKQVSIFMGTVLVLAEFMYANRMENHPLPEYSPMQKTERPDALPLRSFLQEYPVCP